LGELELDTVARAAFVSGAPLHLPAKEYELFEHLVTNRGRAFSRGELIERLYAGTQEINSNVIEALVYALRCKLRGAGLGTLIKTRRHQGYLVE
jgi:DNA-binding response OmpR family regulator